MNVTQNSVMTAVPTPPYSASTRQEKTADFISSALPAAILGGLQGFGARSALNTASLPTSGLARGTPTSGMLAAAGTASAALNVANGIGGIAQLATNWGRSSPSAGAVSGVAAGAAIGTMICPGIGTAIGAGIGAICGGLIGAITCGKHRDQKVRDTVRQELVQLGVLSPDFKLQLPDGTLYDMGKDGGARGEFGGRRPYEVDLSNPLAQYAIGWIDPVVQLLAPGNTKIRNDFAGYFANAAIANAEDLGDVKRNIDHFIQKFGLTNESLVNGIVQMAQGGYIDRTLAEAWISGVAQRAHLTDNQARQLTLQQTPVAENASQAIG